MIFPKVFHLVAIRVKRNSLIIVESMVESYTNKCITIEYPLGDETTKQCAKVRYDIHITLQVFKLIILSWRNPSSFCLPSAGTYSCPPCRSKLVAQVDCSSRRYKIGKFGFANCMSYAILNLHKPMRFKCSLSFFFDLPFLCRCHRSTQY